MPEAYIISTAITDQKGLNALSATQGEAPAVSVNAVIQEALRCAGVSQRQIQLGFWGGVATGLQVSFPMVRVRFYGASSLQAVFCAGRSILAGDAQLVICGGAGGVSHPAQGQALERHFDNKTNPQTPLSVGGAGAMVVASTEAVGAINLTPITRLAAREQFWLGKPPPPEGVSAVMQAALKRAGIRQTDLELAVLDAPNPGGYLKRLAALGIDSILLRPNLPGDAGEAQGILLLDYLVRQMTLRHSRYGLMVQAARLGAVQVCILEGM